MDREIILPTLGLLLSLFFGFLLIYVVVSTEPAATPAVESQEQKNSQPAGPEDKEALPGQ